MGGAGGLAFSSPVAPPPSVKSVTLRCRVHLRSAAIAAAHPSPRSPYASLATQLSSASASAPHAGGLAALDAPAEDISPPLIAARPGGTAPAARCGAARVRRGSAGATPLRTIIKTHRRRNAIRVYDKRISNSF